MKTKILSKLMLVCFTAVMMVGCNNENKEAATKVKEKVSIPESKEKNEALTKKEFSASDCKVCSINDDYLITQKQAITLMCEFHNKILKGSSIVNVGGYFSLLKSKNIGKSASDMNFFDYPSFKFHWGIKDTLTNQKRLFITYETSNTRCNNKDEYTGNPGIEDAILYTSYPQNDILPLTNKDIDLTYDVALNRLKQPFSFSKKHFSSILKKDAEDYLETFQNDDDVKSLYQCDDIVFDKTKTLYPIVTKSGTEAFIYFFGYDEKQIHHRLRLIIGGLDKNGVLIFMDGSKTMLRENSRPRP